MTFSLIFVLVFAGQSHTFVVDTGLSFDDCVVALRASPRAPMYCEEEQPPWTP